MLSLFASLCQISTLHAAWRQVKAKNSVGGIDGFSVLQFDENLQGNLNKLSEELRRKSWNPEPYLRVEIPKKENEKRQLGLLSVKDKIVQQAIKIFSGDLGKCYAKTVYLPPKKQKPETVIIG
jgi:retron-type reverse transcriptase